MLNEWKQKWKKQYFEEEKNDYYKQSQREKVTLYLQHLKHVIYIEKSIAADDEKPERFRNGAE